MSGIERIDCAALCLRSGKVISLPRPARHGDVIRHMIDLLGLTREDVGFSIQGFTTTQRRFVGRAVAFLIAYDAEQLKAETRVIGGVMQLFSEDVW